MKEGIKMIKGIKMQNFKGNSLTQMLTGKDIFTGNNGTGKSSRLQALNYALLGYIPKDSASKSLAETFKNSTGERNNIS